jgi:SOS-response transcriptional repressor LexA
MVKSVVAMASDERLVDGKLMRIARKKLDVSLETLGEMVGLSAGYLSRMERGVRNISMKNLRAIADALNVPASSLVVDEAVFADEPRPPRLPILGEIRAGAWLETDEELPPEPRYLPISPDPRYQSASQYAPRVVGTSMNKVVQAGQFVIVAAWPEIGADLRDGDLVVVRRERAMTYEATLKRARKSENGWQLWPESTDPRYQEPVPLEDGDRDVEVRIVGKVIGRYEPL